MKIKSKNDDNKIINKADLEASLNLKKESDEFFSYFLKRKRIERGMKLGDVASGICSISYLSRVENNQSFPSEDNLKLLFERLDLSYEEVKRNRDDNVFEEMIKKELTFDKTKVIDEISKIISLNAYTNIELDLLVLFGSILSKNYEEAKTILAKQEFNLELFNQKEMIFYLYLFSRYLFETNQNKRAYSQIKVLNSIVINNSVYKLAIYDLSLDIAFVMGENEQVVRFYYLLDQTDNNYLFKNKLLLHKMKVLAVCSTFNPQETIEEFLKLKKMLNMHDPVIRKSYYYCLALVYLKNNSKQKCLEILRDNLDDLKSLALYGYLAKNIGSNSDKQIFSAKYKGIKFTKYDMLYERFCEYIALSIRNESLYHLYNYLKQMILNKVTLFYDGVINEIANKELMMIGINSSKYKDTLRHFLDD